MVMYENEVTLPVDMYSRNDVRSFHVMNHFYVCIALEHIGIDEHERTRSFTYPYRKRVYRSGE
jgi:hypothetical protein